jgi:glucosamine--fructose-6-phosphate aminotransferase (isomerizing)
MTFMEQEARESPEAAQRFLEHNGSVLAELGGRLRAMEPPLILTSARGSSDNAAGYLKYLAEILLGTPCASVGASVASLYGAKLKAHNTLAVTISQSGQSPDIVALQDEAKRAGALSVAIVNVEDSPAARNADICLPLCAGPEKSVAATKTFIVSLVAAASLVAHWLDDPMLKNAIASLPDRLADASHKKWPEFAERLAEVDSLYILGRGPSLPIAAETALKLKETCAVHAEAYSVAEVMHGPLELVGEGFPVLVYAQNDQSLPSTQAAIQRLKAAGAKLLVAGAGGLPVVRAGHPLLEPIVMIQSAYLAIEELARMRGRDPDAPRMLRKVTETV